MTECSLAHTAKQTGKEVTFHLLRTIGLSHRAPHNSTEINQAPKLNTHATFPERQFVLIQDPA